MKKILLMIWMTMLFLVVTACAGKEGEWNGVFYNYIEDDHIQVLTIEREGSDDYVRIKTQTITIDSNGGFASFSSTGAASIIKTNVVEEGDFYRYTLKGDTITVKALVKEDELMGVDYSGTYIRGASVEETFIGGDESYNDNSYLDSIDYMGVVVDGIILYNYYYMKGNSEENALCFYKNGTMVFEYSDGTSDICDYVIKGDEITLSQDGNYFFSFTIIDEDTLEDVSMNIYKSAEIEFNQFYYLDGDYKETSLYFYDGKYEGSWIVDMDYPDGTTRKYDYVIEDGEIYLSLEDEYVTSFTIIDKSTLEEVLGDIYKLESYDYDEEDADNSSQDSSQQISDVLPITDVFYYLDGNPNETGILFYGNENSVEIYDSGERIEKCGYGVMNGKVTFSKDGEDLLELIIIDKFTLKDDAENIFKIPDIIFNEFYYFDGDSDELSLYFYESENSVDADCDGETEAFDYVIDGDKITFSQDGEEIFELTIINRLTLEDDAENTFSLTSPGYEGLLE